MQPAHPERRLGIAYIVAASLAWSLGGVFARLLALDMATMAMWRALLATLMLAVGFVALNRGRGLAIFARFGWRDLLISLAGTVAMIAYIGALAFTTIANVTILYATGPFIAAGLAWFWIGERASARTVLASMVTLTGVAIMLGGSFGTSGLVGDVLALVMTGSFGFAIVAMKRWTGIDMLATTIVSSLLTAVVSAPFAKLGWPTPMELLLLAGFALTSVVMGFFFYIAGARRLGAAEAGLISTLEIGLSPLWVLILFNEIPTRASILGGTVVVGAIVWHLLGDLRRERARP